ncbi:hypothetical protein HN954_04335 [bacterium]|jgi:hypothetical protein|nr:hypothetical protein [bacterium]MBT6831932.1 hypothetical protein [bacterium]MBT6996628.1 hypothetical protein [bacterium]MBT7773048.1 hypothetical protein [bacterium]
MVPEKLSSDNETACRSLWAEFEEIKNLNESARKKRVRRLIESVRIFIAEQKKTDPNFSFESCPWLVQFFPVAVEIQPKMGKLNAVNPGISGVSGMLGTSKNEINDRLDESLRPRNLFFKIVPETRENLDEIFEKKYGEKIQFPVIFKPAVGERASFFECLQENEIDDFLKKNAGEKNMIFEEFADTRSEFGLSWSRDPETEKISIDSLVEKKLPTILGDGTQKISKLVDEKIAELGLSPEKSEKIRNWNRHHADEILPAGETRVISRAASISFGTKFQKISVSADDPALVAAVEKMIKNPDGIFAGRFDLRSENLEELKNGNFKIIEMNGIGGMPLEIYEPERTISEKYEILFAHFQKLIRIGEKNLAAGRGEEISFLKSVLEVRRHFFGGEKKQELPDGVWRDFAEVLKISHRGRIAACWLGAKCRALVKKVLKK